MRALIALALLVNWFVINTADAAPKARISKVTQTHRAKVAQPAPVKRDITVVIEFVPETTWQTVLMDSLGRLRDETCTADQVDIHHQCVTECLSNFAWLANLQRAFNSAQEKVYSAQDAPGPIRVRMTNAERTRALEWKSERSQAEQKSDEAWSTLLRGWHAMNATYHLWP